MGLLDSALAPLRSLLGSTEREAERVFPVQDIEEIQTRVLGNVDAIRDATESMAHQIETLETLAASVPALTDAVKELTTQLAVVAEVLKPVAGAERDVAKLGHLFGRHRQDSAPDPPPQD